MKWTNEARNEILEHLKIMTRGTDADTPDGDDVSMIMSIIEDDDNMKELQMFKDKNTGLYCIDKDPKTVTKKWIEINSFQI